MINTIDWTTISVGIHEESSCAGRGTNSHTTWCNKIGLILYGNMGFLTPSLPIPIQVFTPPPSIDPLSIRPWSWLLTPSLSFFTLAFFPSPLFHMVFTKIKDIYIRHKLQLFDWMNGHDDPSSLTWHLLIPLSVLSISTPFPIPSCVHHSERPYIYYRCLLRLHGYIVQYEWPILLVLTFNCFDQRLPVISQFFQVEYL